MAETITKFEIPDAYKEMDIARVQRIADRYWVDVYLHAAMERIDGVAQSPPIDRIMNIAFIETLAVLSAKSGDPENALRLQHLADDLRDFRDVEIGSKLLQLR